MNNPFFGVGRPNVMQQFQQFMGQMQGQDPDAIIQQMMQSGRLSQAQYNMARQQAQQMQGMFEGLRSMFGK